MEKMADLPKELWLSNIAGNQERLELWTYAQLELLQRENLKRRAVDLHDHCNRVKPGLSAMAPSGSSVSLIQQIIDLQIDLVRALGLAGPQASADFGVPIDTVTFPADVASNPNHKPAAYKPTPQYSSRVEEEFCHNDAYIQAAADSKAAAKESRKIHRGTVGDFLFGDSNAKDAVMPTDLSGAPMPPPPAYQVTPPYNMMAPKPHEPMQPPYQIMPPNYRPNTMSGKYSIAASSFQQPPPHFYSQHQ